MSSPGGPAPRLDRVHHRHRCSAPPRGSNRSEAPSAGGTGPARRAREDHNSNPGWPAGFAVEEGPSDSPPHQHPQALGEPLFEIGEGEHAESTRRQFEGEGNPRQQATNRGDAPGVRGVKGCGARTDRQHEQLHGLRNPDHLEGCLLGGPASRGEEPPGSFRHRWRGLRGSWPKS